MALLVLPWVKKQTILYYIFNSFSTLPPTTKGKVVIQVSTRNQQTLRTSTQTKQQFTSHSAGIKFSSDEDLHICLQMKSNERHDSAVTLQFDSEYCGGVV